MKPSREKILIALVMVLLGAGAIAGYFWYQGQNYVSTIDARIDATMINVTPQASGKLVEFNGYDGQTVEKDQKLGTVESGNQASSLSAPISGELVRVNVNEGQSVSLGQTAAVVADMDHLFISANIEETKIAKVALDQGVEIRLDAFPGEVFLGKITKVSDASTSVFSTISSSSSNGNYTKITQLIPIEIEFIQDYNLPYKLGMNAEIKIHIKSGGRK